jgi:hypothetical protein
MDEILKIVQEELKAAEAKEAEASENASDQDWNRAYGAYWALQNLIDKIEREKGIFLKDIHE